MKVKNKIHALLNERILILDGATGTELQKRGMPAGASPEIWSAQHPGVLEEIHRDYVDAGADIIFACTFGANRFKLRQYQQSDVRGLNARLAGLARRSAGRRALVAGDIGPTGQFVKPFGTLDFETAVTGYKEQVAALDRAGVDLFVIETMMDIQEARAALLAVKETTDKCVFVTMTFEKEGRSLYGTDPVTALITLQSLGADGVGCNCSTGPQDMAVFIEAMRPYARVPLIAKPNAGMPHLVKDSTLFDLPPAAFAAHAKVLVARGASMVGGCCGTTPAHIRAVRAAVRAKRPLARTHCAPCGLSSARGHVIIDGSRPLIVVGERINPTGKPELQKELAGGRFALVRQMAREQQQQGAQLLDVNVGGSGIDEVRAMKEAVEILSLSCDLPLVIDSSHSDTIEAALRVYPGRALINSISGEAKKRDRLLRLAAKYGAMFILLPVTDKGIPKDNRAKMAVIRDIFAHARSYGFSKDDFIVDGLTMSVAADPLAAVHTLETVEWCSKEFGGCSVLGASNVSFGLPQRKWLNAAFLALAQEKGLTMAIINPASEELMGVKRASDVLTGRDSNARSFIAHYSRVAKDSGTASAGRGVSPEQNVSRLIVEGNRESIEPAVKSLLTAGFSAERIVEEVMVPALASVGERFEKKEYFLPQLIASAETAKKAFAYLKRSFMKGEGHLKGRKTVLLATVKGDIHDIGKNIVALMLENSGFFVVDLGKDVPTSTIIAAIRKHRPDVVGLSALMTTTMVVMKEVITAASREGLRCRFMVGGAVVTGAYAKSIGAAYGRDAVEAVRIARQL